MKCLDTVLARLAAIQIYTIIFLNTAFALLPWLCKTYAEKIEAEMSWLGKPF